VFVKRLSDTRKVVRSCFLRLWVCTLCDAVRLSTCLFSDHEGMVMQKACQLVVPFVQRWRRPSCRSSQLSVTSGGDRQAHDPLGG
jgi:hypothetical protein